MSEQNYLAIDLGAESGRGILAGFDGQRLHLTELGRFATAGSQENIGADGVRRWSFDRIGDEVDLLVQKASQEVGDDLKGVGADTWGVDFGLLDAQGTLLEPPIQYRDASHIAARERAFAMVPAEELWAITGIQPLPFNTLYQLLAIQERDPGLLERAAHLLLIPDLLHRRLTGDQSLLAEVTDASTSQMLDPWTKQWSHDVPARFGLPSHFLGALTTAGTMLGTTPGGAIPVYAVATHDTASAVVATPADPKTRWAFLSSGTWSLLGVERSEPLLSIEALHRGFSNETGVAGTTRLLQNIMGLWLVQECRRVLLRGTGRDYSYAELTLLAEAAPAGGALIDALDNRFLAPSDMVAEIGAACRETGQAPPQEVGPLIRCCLESLALAYRRALHALAAMTGQTFDVLHIVGGGSQNRFLNQLAADACGIPVVAGPSEATAVGNVLAQMVGSGAILDWAEARLVSRASFPIETYMPRSESREPWDSYEARLTQSR